ncbi:hypothetical protein QTP88_009245 [Uroleucon formosanum]
MGAFPTEKIATDADNRYTPSAAARSDHVTCYKDPSLIGFFFHRNTLCPVVAAADYYCCIIIFTVRYAKRHCVSCVLRILITVEKVDDRFEKKPPPSSFLRPPQTGGTLQQSTARRCHKTTRK